MAPSLDVQRSLGLPYQGAIAAGDPDASTDGNVTRHDIRMRVAIAIAKTSTHDDDAWPGRGDEPGEDEVALPW